VSLESKQRVGKQVAHLLNLIYCMLVSVKLTVKLVMKILNFILFVFASSVALAANNPAPLNDAVRNADFETVQHLLSLGTNPNELNNYGSSALSGAAGNCSRDSIKIIKLLFDNGAKLNHQNRQGLTPIGNASALNCYQNAQLLMQLGADPEIAANNGWTPLISAVANQNINLVKLFLNAGVSKAYVNKSGYDASFFANKIKNPEIIELLNSYRPLVVRDESINTCGLENADGAIYQNCSEASESTLQPKYDFEYKNIIVSFLVTWSLILFPPILIRLLAKKPHTKLVSLVISIALFFTNIILFTVMGGQSKTHFATMLGAIFCYSILTIQFKNPVSPEAENQLIKSTTNALKRKLILSRSKKIWIASSTAWLGWVTFRTVDSYEVIGFYLDQWDDSYYFLNLFGVPVLVAVIIWSFNWIRKNPNLSNIDASK